MIKNIALLLIGLVLAACSYAAEQPKPNIVHIMVDDLGWQDIASHKIDGKPVYETPNLDRLTENGRRFTEAYAPSPVCAPSRVSFLRGQYQQPLGLPEAHADQVVRRRNVEELPVEHGESIRAEVRPLRHRLYRPVVGKGIVQFLADRAEAFVVGVLHRGRGLVSGELQMSTGYKNQFRHFATEQFQVVRLLLVEFRHDLRDDVADCRWV